MNDLKFQEIVSFENPPIFIEKKWSDDAIWKDIKKYPRVLQEKFNVLREATHEYLTTGFTTEFFNKFHFTHSFMKSFTCNLIKTELFEKSFLISRGIWEEVGLVWCCYKILEYYKQNLRPPSCSEPLFTTIYYYCKTGALKKHGIKTWKELLNEGLKGYQAIELERISIQGKAGLRRASNHLQKIYDEKGRIPKVLDSGVKLIAHAVHRGSWIQFGINTWPDLLRYVFGTDKIPNWTGLGGLRRAQEIIKKIAIEKFPEMPKKTDISYDFSNPLRKNYWVEFGINNWNDLFRSVCGDNFSPIIDWQGECGYLEAQKQLKTFYLNHQKLPVYKDFLKISQRCSKKYWIDFKIYSWNDLLLKVFGKINHDLTKWHGQIGLNLAQKLIKNFYNEHNCWPKTKFSPFNSISKVICMKRWTSFGIKSWKDLIHSVSLKI